MKITFHIDVGIDVENYEEAGKILDKVSQKIEKTIGEKGRYDIGSFQARHRPIHDFSDEPQAMMAMVETPERIR